jgi:hypothetical protein
MKTKLLKLALCAMALMPMGAWGEAKLIDINFAELAVETQGERCATLQHFRGPLPLLVHNTPHLGTKLPDVWYRGACFLIAAWRQQYCWLEATVLLAGGSNRRSAYLVPANAVC